MTVAMTKRLHQGQTVKARVIHINQRTFVDQIALHRERRSLPVDRFIFTNSLTTTQTPVGVSKATKENIFFVCVCGEVSDLFEITSLQYY